jgi:hypothetical protein
MFGRLKMKFYICVLLITIKKLSIMEDNHYDPNQPRDKNGEWSKTINGLNIIQEAKQKMADNINRENETLKPTVTEISDKLQEAFKDSGSSFQGLLRTTSTWEKHLKLVQAKYKELQGSEKQIAWAKKIRDEKTELFLIGHVSDIWNMNAIKNGGRGFGIKMTEEDSMKKIKERAKEFDFLFSSFATKIIDNRD